MHCNFPRFRGPLLAVALAFAAACAPTLDQRGYVPSPGDVASIELGIDTRDSILERLGTPSATATFSADSWYYISRTTETVAFLSPKVLDQQVVAVDFDADGTVVDVRRYTLDDANRVVPVDRVTPTRGRELGIIEQLIGNVGRFRNQPGPAR